MRYLKILLITLFVLNSCAENTNQNSNSAVNQSSAKLKDTITKQADTLNNYNINRTPEKINSNPLDKKTIYKIKLEKLRKHKKGKEIENLLK